MGAFASDAAAGPPATEVGAARLEHPGGSPTGALLVPVRYPLYMAGRRAMVRVALLGAHGILERATATARLAAGVQRRPDRRRAFRFVHRVALGEGAIGSRLLAGRVRVRATARLDADGDGDAEARSADVSLQRVHRVRRARASATCASVPVARVRPGKVVRVQLPSCDRPLRWWIGARPRHGKARRTGGRIAYRPARDHRGLDELVLRGRPTSSAVGAAAPAVSVPVRLHVGSSPKASPKVRALGDSVTAGFGFYANGRAMLFTSLYSCRPTDSYNDACSSNSLTTNSSQGDLSFAPDYGLSNNISWAAQWANAHGITNYKNVGVSGSAPSDWIAGGPLYTLTQGVEADKPDYVVLTLGANPLLSDALFGIDTMGCALESDLLGDFTQCVTNAFASVNLEQNLTAIYKELLSKTKATILLMQYHLSIPSVALAYSAVQIEQMGDLLNGMIASVAESLGSPRLRVVAPPRFNVGIDMTPLAPNTFTCSSFGYSVDGQSVQARVTQAELILSHPLSFCKGPAGGGRRWVISADTGIHPSAAGYAQMAGAMPPP
jgi:lysophospholipase L1-like esterase